MSVHVGGRGPGHLGRVQGGGFYPDAVLALTFTEGRYRSGAGSSFTGDFAAVGGASITRASVGYAETAAGALVQFAPGVARITDRGLLVEEARTNLFLNAFAPVTQNVTITAASHTITIWGSGSVTVTAGTATISNGGAVTAGSPRTIGCTVAGTITVTVAGGPTAVNVELGVFGTSPMPSTGTPFTRPADQISLGNVALTYPLTAVTRFQALEATSTNLSLLGGATGGPAIQLGASRNAASAIRAVASLATTVNMYVTGTVSGIAAMFTNGDSRISLSGGAVATSATAFVPVSPNTLGLGHDALAGAQQLNGYLKSVIIYPRALTNAELISASA